MATFMMTVTTYCPGWRPYMRRFRVYPHVRRRAPGSNIAGASLDIMEFMALYTSGDHRVQTSWSSLATLYTGSPHRWLQLSVGEEKSFINDQEMRVSLCNCKTSNISGLGNEAVWETHDETSMTRGGRSGAPLCP